MGVASMKWLRAGQLISKYKTNLVSDQTSLSTTKQIWGGGLTIKNIYSHFSVRAGTISAGACCLSDNVSDLCLKNITLTCSGTVSSSRCVFTSLIPNKIVP